MSRHTPESPAPSPPAGPRRVLLADDERLLHSVLQDVLEVNGFAVLHALDGRQAVQLAQEEKPDVILMDLMMPVMDGMEALEHLREDEDTRGIPVVAITADVLGRSREDMLGHGFDGYIPKPFTAGQLLGEIARHLARDGGRR
ncbi:MAG TPA: response regulator [Longimicrobiaceae bacterium]|nr:response regulator [Longimicrobiaceae bacterium]